MISTIKKAVQLNGNNLSVSEFQHEAIADENLPAQSPRELAIECIEQDGPHGFIVLAGVDELVDLLKETLPNEHYEPVKMAMINRAAELLGEKL